ncbi:Tricalbin-2, partial [Coemansia brasiliensis]
HDTLMFEVKCRPPGVNVSSDEMIAIGKVEYPMMELLRQKLVNTAEPVWLPLDAETGEVLALVRYDPVEDPQLLPGESITDQGMVRMRIASATNLPAADKSGTSDPYVVALIDGVKVWESETVKKTLNPRWNEQAELGIRQRNKTVLTLEVYDWNQIQSHTLLGTLTLPLKDLPIGKPVEKSYGLAASNGKAEIQLKFLFKPGYVEQHDDSSPVLLDVAHTVVKAPVTVIKGGASIVGNVVGGIFDRISSKKHHLLGGGSRRRGGSVGSSNSDEQPPEEERKLSAAAQQAMRSAENMPRDDDDSGARPQTSASTRKQAGSRPQSPRSGGTVAATAIPMPRLSDSSEAFPSPGTVHITVLSAEARDGRKRNLMVSISLNHKTTYKTQVEKDAVSAVWDDEHMELPVLQGSVPELQVSLKDHSSFRSDKTVSEFMVNVYAELKSDILANNGAQGAAAVQLQSDTGAIGIKLEFISGKGMDETDTGSVAGSMRGHHSERHKRRGSAFSRKSLR